MGDQAMQAHYTEKAKDFFESSAYKSAITSIILEHNSNKDCHYYMKCGKKLSIVNASLSDYHQIVSPMVLNDTQKRGMFMRALGMKLIECYGVKPYEIHSNGSQELYGISDEHRAIISKYVNPGAYLPKYNDNTKHGESDKIEQPTKQNVVDIPDHIVKQQLESILEHGKEVMGTADADEVQKTFEANIATPHQEPSQAKFEADAIEKTQAEEMNEDRKNLI